jgi:hypothetical protein
MNGEQVLEVEGFRKAAFDINDWKLQLMSPLCEIKRSDFENGTIEIKMYSDILDPSSFPVQGIYWIAFRVNDTTRHLSQFICAPALVGQITSSQKSCVQYFAILPQIRHARKTDPATMNVLHPLLSENGLPCVLK